MKGTGLMTTVLLRADASAIIGTGHVMRGLAIAEALQDRGIIPHLAATRLTLALETRLNAAGICVHHLESPTAEATLACAAALNAAALIIDGYPDGYQFDSFWRAALRAGFAHPILTFDDTATLPALYADLIVNPAPQAATLPYARIAPDAQWLLGPAYLPLRREFRTAAAVPSPPMPERRDLLITFGGADPLALTTPCLESLASLVTDPPPSSPIPGPRSLIPVPRLVVAIGGSDPNAATVLAAVKRWNARSLTPAPRIVAYQDCPDMGARMAAAGLAIAAGGGTLGELAALCVPTILVIVADNQESAAAAIRNEGWAVAVDARDDRPGALARIRALARGLWPDLATRTAMAAHARGRTDGQGAARIADALLEIGT